MLRSWPPAYQAGRSFLVRRPGFYSCPLLKPLLCSVPRLAAFQCHAEHTAPPVKFSPPVLLSVQQGTAQLAEAMWGCSELACCCARDSLWSPNRLRGPICPCTPCPDSLQQMEPVQPPSARVEMGTVLTPALAGRALESAANAAQWRPDSIEVLQGIKLELSLQSSCPSYRICVPVPRFVVMRVFTLQHP